jgi:2-phospho-L-lactate/phosphoenolpyruvate guanylyltransferase
VRSAVLIPVKSFVVAKRRLAPVLAPPERAALAKAMAARVLAAAAPLPAYVVCDDVHVADWAATSGAGVLWRPGLGLNGAVTDGVASLAGVGFDHVVVAHADLPLAHDLGGVITADTVTIVPDRRDDGTNVISVPSRSGFRFRYGPASAARHREEADRLGLACVVRRDARLAHDVDVSDDLAHPMVQEVIPWRPTSPANPH